MWQSSSHRGTQHGFLHHMPLMSTAAMGVVTLLCALWVLHLHVAPAHGVGLCTPERAQAIRDSMGPSISEATKCPEPTWKHAFFHDLQNATRPAVVYDIGCNKGFDALATLKSLTHNPRVSLVRWKQKTGFDCGVCGQCQEGARGAERPLARERLQLFCVEPMPGTFGVLLNAASHFKYNRMGLIVQYGAFTSRADAEKRNWFVKFPTGPSKVWGLRGLRDGMAGRGRARGLSENSRLGPEPHPNRKVQRKPLQQGQGEYAGSPPGGGGWRVDCHFNVFAS